MPIFEDLEDRQERFPLSVRLLSVTCLFPKVGLRLTRFASLAKSIHYMGTYADSRACCRTGEGIGRDSAGFYQLKGSFVLFNPKTLQSYPI